LVREIGEELEEVCRNGLRSLEIADVSRSGGRRWLETGSRYV